MSTVSFAHVSLEKTVCHNQFPPITLDVAGYDSCATYISKHCVHCMTANRFHLLSDLFVLFLSSCIKRTASFDKGVQLTLLDSFSVCQKNPILLETACIGISGLG